MREPNPDGRGGGSRQPDNQHDDDWFIPQGGMQRGPDPRDVAGELGHGRHHHNESRRRLNVDRTRALFLRTTSVDLRATSLDLKVAPMEPLELQGLQGRKAGRNWVPIAGTALFLVDTIFMADGFASPVSIGSRLLVIFIWLVSLAVVAVLWLRASPRLFEQALVQVAEVVRTVRARIGSLTGSGDAMSR